MMLNRNFKDFKFQHKRNKNQVLFTSEKIKADSEILNFAIAKNLENLVRNVDIISLHVPLTPETHEVFNQDIFRVSKKGLLIINTSRGKLVNNMDILRAIEENFISGYITDVLDTEPIVALAVLIIFLISPELSFIIQ